MIRELKLVSDLKAAGINLGYGVCKVKTDNGFFKHTSDINRASNKKLQLRFGIASAGTQVVNYKGLTYEVGEGACLTSAPRRKKKIYSKWAGNEVYMVLMQSILERLALEGSDWIVTLGVPLEEMNDDAYTDKVIHLWKGEHETENGIVRIHSPMVVSEPTGALFYYGEHVVPLETLEHQNLTICDFGYGTTLCTTHHRLVLDEDNTTHIPAGVGKVIEHASKLIHEQYKELRDVVEIEMAMLGKWPLYIDGKAIDLKPIIARAVEYQGAEIIAKMKTNMPAPARNIYLTGGGTHLFKDLMQREFPDHHIEWSDEPQDVNAHGLKLISDERRAELVQQKLEVA